jgi:DNA polymerase Ligase (LigD)
MPRYVVLQHDPPNENTGDVHWDFMIETGAALRTWALEEEPTAEKAIPAKALADHRPVYLDYEGPISGDRGTVSKWDAGSFETLAETPTELHLHLIGGRLSGTVKISQNAADAQRWTFVFSA